LDGWEDFIQAGSLKMNRVRKRRMKQLFDLEKTLEKHREQYREKRRKAKRLTLTYKQASKYIEKIKPLAKMIFQHLREELGILEYEIELVDGRMFIVTVPLKVEDFYIPSEEIIEALNQPLELEDEVTHPAILALDIVEMIDSMRMWMKKTVSYTNPDDFIKLLDMIKGFKITCKKLEKEITKIVEEPIIAAIWRKHLRGDKNE